MGNDDDTDQRIREQAYELWQKAGSPEGEEEEFWHQAREIVLNGENSNTVQGKKRPAKEA
jgi:hypothetical protein